MPSWDFGAVCQPDWVSPGLRGHKRQPVGGLLYRSSLDYNGGLKFDNWEMPASGCRVNLLFYPVAPWASL